MAKTDVLVLSIDDQNVPRFATAMLGIYGWQDEIDGAPNPETKEDFVNRKFRAEMLTRVKRQERRIYTDGFIEEPLD